MAKYSMDEMKLIFESADSNLHGHITDPLFEGEFAPSQKKIDLFEDVHELSLFIHVPFFQQMNPSCAYTCFPGGSRQDEKRYLAAMKEQLDSFLETHRIELLRGFDIGGGSPTALSDDGFYSLMELHCEIESRLEKSDDYEKSIEISFAELNHSKTLLLGQAGFKRVSAAFPYADIKPGQSEDPEENPLFEVREQMELLHHAGVEKINLDIMYGIPGQDDASLMQMLDALMLLHPEQVTVYETKYNPAEPVPEGLTRELQYRQYSLIYDYLTEHGFKGRFGGNTFSLVGDKGVSSYINSRMTDAVPYKGFGPSTESMSDRGISYEALKETSLTTYPETIDWSARVIYELPPEEITAKYICDALCGGRFNIGTASRLFKDDFKVSFSDEIEYLHSRGFIEETGHWISLTQKGFRYCVAVGAMFWSERQKQMLVSGNISK